MNKQEKELFVLINNYRQRNGVPLLQPSPNLAYVARTHAIDVVENDPDVNGGTLHSWSNKDKWIPVIYTSDDKQAKLIWSKPSELTNYKFNGFELVFNADRNSRKITTITPNTVINSWFNSKVHNDVILEQGALKSLPIKAMGVGIYKGFACAWFGQQIDIY